MTTFEQPVLLMQHKAYQIFSIRLHEDDIQDFDTSWDQAL